jgi:SAM-dependent methyltransferase
MEAIRFLQGLPGKDVLQIGLGAGSLPRILQADRFKVDVVEIDPLVRRFAEEHFEFSTQGETFEEDARTYVRRTARRYDVVVHDTFTGGTTPEHLLSVEVIRQIHEILRPGGALVLNFVGQRQGANVEASWLVARTLRSTFASVRVFADSTLEDVSDEPANLIFFASDQPVTFSIPSEIAFENDAAVRVLASFQRWEVMHDVPAGQIITDAHNPLARLQLTIAAEHFNAMSRLLPVEVWAR